LTRLGVVDQRRGVALNGLALTSIAQKKLVDGKEYLMQALAVFQKTLGPGHPDVAACLITIGDLHYTVAEYDIALAFYQQAYEIIDALVAREILPETLLIVPLCNIAGSHFALNRFDEAQPLLNRVIQLIDTSGLQDDADLTWALTKLAAIHINRKQNSEADTLLTRALPLAETLYGPNSPTVMPIVADLASLRFAKNSYNEAEALYKRLLAQQQQKFEPDAAQIAATQHTLGLVIQAKKQYPEAIQYLGQALAAREHVDPDSLETAATLQVLGEIYNAQKDYSAAWQVLQRTLRIREVHVGRTHEETGVTLGALAWTAYYMGDYEEAVTYAKRAAPIIQSDAAKRDSAAAAQRQLVLGISYFAQEKYPEAEPPLKNALAIGEKALGPEHPELLPMLKHYADVLLKLDRPLEAVELIQRIREIETKHNIQYAP